MSPLILFLSLVVHMTLVSQMPEENSLCDGKYTMTVRYTMATALRTHKAKHMQMEEQTRRSFLDMGR